MDGLMVYAKVYYTKKQAVWEYEHFLSTLSKVALRSKIKTFDYKQMVKIGNDEIWFLCEVEYPTWCKGRTYMMNGRNYHSGYCIMEYEKWQ